jgi:hypothetical protein
VGLGRGPAAALGLGLGRLPRHRLRARRRRVESRVGVSWRRGGEAVGVDAGGTNLGVLVARLEKERGTRHRGFMCGRRIFTFRFYCFDGLTVLRNHGYGSTVRSNPRLR